MTDAIITGPGLYVLRNGKFKEITEIHPPFAEDNRGSRWSLEKGSRVAYSWTDEYDIIRRATPEEAAKFCGGSDE